MPAYVGSSIPRAPGAGKEPDGATAPPHAKSTHPPSPRQVRHTAAGAPPVRDCGHHSAVAPRHPSRDPAAPRPLARRPRLGDLPLRLAPGLRQPRDWNARYPPERPHRSQPQDPLARLRRLVHRPQAPHRPHALNPHLRVRQTSRPFTRGLTPHFEPSGVTALHNHNNLGSAGH